VRLASSNSEHVPFKVSKDDGKIKVLDGPPEVVGNFPGDAQDWKVGHMSLGGPGSLKPNAVYEAFDGRAARERQ